MSNRDHLTTEEAFQERLRELANEAMANGVDVQGGWPLRFDDPDRSDLDVEIVALAGPDL